MRRFLLLFPTMFLGIAMMTAAACADEASSADPYEDYWTEINTEWEVRGGFSNHDMQTTSDPFNQEEEGFDTHLEVMSPSMIGWGADLILNPRLHAGLSLNSAGKTSRAYSGFTWEFALLERLSFEFGFGLGVHNGELDEPKDPVTLAEIDDGRPALGSRVLFREEFAFSYWITDATKVVVFYEHYSNGGIFDDRNEGMDAAGVKLGFKL